MSRNEATITRVVIKLLTHNNMYYTYNVLDENTDIVKDYKTLEGELTLAEKLGKATESCLEELEHVLNKQNVVYAPIDEKIISTKEIKEVLIFKY